MKYNFEIMEDIKTLMSLPWKDQVMYLAEHGADERFIRALNPFIVANTTFRGNLMRIMKAEVASDAFCIPHPAGTVAKIEDDKFFIATAKGLIVPTVLQFGSFFIGDSKDFIRIVNPKIGEEFK